MATANISGSRSSGPLPGAALPSLNVLKIVVLLLIVLGSAYFFWREGEWFRDPAQIKNHVVSWGIWGPTVYILLYAIGPSFLVPGAVMTVAAGLAFGTLWGSVYSIVGADLGALVAFAAGRYLGRDLIQRRFGARFQRWFDRIERHGFQIIFYLRIVPIIPYNALNLIAGASPIDFRDYFWASMIGMIPGSIAFAFLGNEMWHPASPRFLAALLLVVLSVFAGELYRRFGPIRTES